MSIDISYARIETEISDYRSGTKRKEEDMFGMLTKCLADDKMEIELLTFKGVINCTSQLKGPDKLDITTILNDGSEKVMSQTRALNTEYKESVGIRGIPENGIVVDAIQVEIDDRTMSLKIVKEEKSGDVMAVVKEMHIPITEDQYLEQRKKFL